MLIQENAHLERLLAKANQDKNLLRNMKKPLLGKNACVQGQNEDVSKAVVRGPKREKEGQSTPYLG